MNPEIYGVLAIILGTAGFLWKNPRHILIMASMATTTWCVYYIALGETSPLISSSIGLATMVLSIFVPEKWMKPIMLGSCGLVGLLIFQSDFSLIGAVIWLGYSTKTVGLLWRDDPYTFRTFMVGGELFYLIFGLSILAWSAIAWSSFTILSAIFSGLYFARKNKITSPKLQQ